MDWMVVLAYLVVIVLIIIIPFVLGKILTKKLNVPWKPFIYGAVFFFVVQLFHTPLVLLIQAPFMKSISFLQNQTLELAVLSIFLGLLAGLFEEIGRYLIFKRYYKKKVLNPTKESALLFGTGWGFGECIFVGVILLISLVSYTMLTPLTQTQIQDINASMDGTLTNAQLEKINAQVDSVINQSPGYVFFGLIERIWVIVMQIGFTMIVFSAVVLNKKWLLVFAIAYHTFMDALFVFISQTWGLLPTETLLGVLAIITFFYVRSLFTKQNSLSHS
ncbi:MAG: YhfC family glutamic-type intramembrane protease [archaeon]|jgi:uncharacterized membrane protein YhfC